jgi:hypothetical protein
MSIYDFASFVAMAEIIEPGLSIPYKGRTDVFSKDRQSGATLGRGRARFSHDQRSHQLNAFIVERLAGDHT